MSFDVARVRGLYSSLGDGWCYLNASSFPQIPESVASAVNRSFRTASQMIEAESDGGGSHSRSATPGQLRATEYLAGARRAIADLTGSHPQCVVLGPNLPSLYRQLGQAMSKMLRHSSVVLSRLDHPLLANALLDLAETRWAQPDLATGALPSFQYDNLVDGSTRLVAFSAAQNQLGTVAPVADIVEKVHAHSRAWVLVDASSYAAYRPIDNQQWDADIIGVELSQLGGPQLAALVFRTEQMFDRLVFPLDDAPQGADKLASPVSPALAAGASAVVDHLADVGVHNGTRRHRLAEAMAELKSHIDTLNTDLLYYLGALSEVHIMGVSGEAADGGIKERIARVTFGVRGVPAQTVYRRLIDNHVVTTVTTETPLLRDMGMDEIGGAVTVGLSPFNTDSDIRQLVRVVASLA